MVDSARVAVDTKLRSLIAIFRTAQVGIAFIDHASDIGTADVKFGILANFGASGDRSVDTSRGGVFESGVTSVVRARARVVTKVNGVNAAVSGIALVEGANVIIVANQRDRLASETGRAEVAGTGVAIVAISSSMETGVSSNASSTGVIGTQIAILTEVGTDTVSSAGTESTASKTAWVTGNINACGCDQSIQDGGESTKGISVKCGVNSTQIRSDLLDFDGIVVTNSDAEKSDASSLGVCKSRSEISNGVLSIRENDEDSIDWTSIRILSSVIRDIVEGRCNSTSNASGSSILIGSSQRLQEESLRIGEGNDESRHSSKKGQSHAGVVGSPSIRVGNGTSECLHDLEITSRDGTRFIEGELKIDLLRASRNWTIGGMSVFDCQQIGGDDIGKS